MQPKVIPASKLTSLLKNNTASVITSSNLKQIRKDIVTKKERDLSRSQELDKADMERQADLERSRKIREFDDNRKQDELFFEKEDRVKKDQIRLQADFLMEEQLDEVKSMNSRIMEAKCMTVRAKQIEQKKMLREMERQRELELDRMMLLHAEQKEKERRIHDKNLEQSRYQGARDILRQLDVKEERRRRALELQEKERLELIERQKQLLVEEQEKLAQKEVEARKLRETLDEANQVSILTKEQQRLLEIEEDRKIAEYQLQKDEQLQRLEQEKLDRQREKDLEYARLRSKQERFNDRRAELDALLARRVQEEVARKRYDEELNNKAKKKKELDDILQIREMQITDKKLRAAQALRQNQDMYNNIAEERNQKYAEAERVKSRLEQDAMNNRQVVEQQIKEKEAQKAQLRELNRQEGMQFAQQNDRYKERLTKIKDRKINEMAKNDVPEYFLSDLKRFSLEPRR
ncbi:hypothetical protein PCE1_001206 [Barthelona sp. PCE]